jgi:cell division protein FtsN
VSRIKVEGKNYFRVRLGPYSDRDAALEALDRVKHLGIDGRVLKGE